MEQKIGSVIVAEPAGCRIPIQGGARPDGDVPQQDEVGQRSGPIEIASGRFAALAWIIHSP